MLSGQRIAFLGGGHITGIILDNLHPRQLVPPENLTVSDPLEARRLHLAARFGLRTTADNVQAVRQAHLIFVNVRPEAVAAVIADLQAARLEAEQVVISLAAGIPLSRYACLGARPLVRALPNPPSQIGQGLAALAFSPQVSAAQRQTVLALFGALGQVLEVEEAHLNAITSLSSPVTTYLFYQALAEAGVRCGLPEAVAARVAARTVSGSLALLEARGVSPAELIREASTPGGISVECLRVLEEKQFTDIIAGAITAGAERADTLGSGSAPITAGG